MMPTGTCPYDGTPIHPGTLQCPRCGTLFYPAAPASSNTGKAVAIVIGVVVLFVVITIVLAAVLYVMVSGLIGSGDPSLPIVSWTGHSLQAGSGDDWEFRVASISQATPFGDLRVGVLRGSAMELGPDSLAPLSPVLGTPGGPHLNVSDNDGSTTLTSGDTFVLGNAQPGQAYTVELFWFASGAVIAQKAIST